MIRTVLAALAFMRLSGPGVEPLLSTEDIHRTVGEPHRIRPAGPTPATLRVVTWNIERGVRYEAVAGALRSLEADVLLLQEVDRHCRRSGYRDVARDLAHDLGMNWVFAGEFQEIGEGRRRQPATTGQAVLSRYPIQEADAAKFRAQDRWRWSFNPVQPRRGGRIVLTARIDDLRVYNTHAESGNNEPLRARQLMEILEADRRHDNLEAVIAGDLNTSFASGELMRQFEQAAFADVAHNGTDRRATSRGRPDPIDWVLAKGLAVHVAEIVETSWAVSDHRPVLVSLQRPRSIPTLPDLVLNDLDSLLAEDGLAWGAGHEAAASP